MLTKASFIITTINNSIIVKSTKIDSTIKAIINNYKDIKGKKDNPSFFSYSFILIF